MAYTNIDDPSAHFQTNWSTQALMLINLLLMMVIAIYNQIGFLQVIEHYHLIQITEQS